MLLGILATFGVILYKLFRDGSDQLGTREWEAEC